MTEKKPDILSQRKVESLIIAACAAQLTSESQLQTFVYWARDALINAALVNFAINGELKVDVTHPDPNAWVWNSRESEEIRR